MESEAGVEARVEIRVCRASEMSACNACPTLALPASAGRLHASNSAALLGQPSNHDGRSGGGGDDGAASN